MSYEPTVWADGDIITAEKLNKIEDCIASLIDYDKTIWVDGDRITSGLLNKIEDGISRCFNYEKTLWKLGDVITAEKLNKIETALQWAAKPFSDLTWDEVFTAIEDNKYKTFKLGDEHDLEIGSEGTVSIAINAIDKDILASDNTKTAPLTLVVRTLPATYHAMNITNSGGNQPGHGTINGWKECGARTYLIDTILPLIPEAVRNRIKTVVKYSDMFNTSGELVKNDVSEDAIWLLSSREVGGEGFETAGIDYSDFYLSDEIRVKTSQSDAIKAYWLRTGVTANNFGVVNGYGQMRNDGCAQRYFMAFGVCLG